jgi:ankyrin repeat protein
MMEDELCAAVSTQDPDLIRKLIQDGANPDSLNSSNHLPLNVAISLGNLRIVELLLAMHCSVGRSDGFGRFPLHEAALTNKPNTADVVNLLLAHGASPDSRDYHGETPLMTACYWNNIDVIEALAACAADVNYQTVLMNRAAIHYATMRQDIDATSVLLRYGADASLWDDDYETPLIIATRSNSVYAVNALLTSHCLINYKGFMDYTALHWAVYGNHIDIVKQLLNHGASVNESNCLEKLPLHMAASSNAVESAQLLLKAGAETECVDSKGDTPLIAAVQLGYSSVVKVLLYANAYPDQLNPDIKSNLLMIALEKAYTDIAKDLILAGCSRKPYWANKEQFTPNKGQDFFKHMVQNNGKLGEVVQNHVNKVNSLQHTCRLTIRQHLSQGNQVHEDIQQLSLPAALKQYVAMKELLLGISTGVI